MINDKIANYEIKEDKIIELDNHYKIGDSACIIDKRGRIKFEEEIDSFYYTYSWYITPVDIKEDEKKIITVSYKSPHYYNTIFTKNYKNNQNIEDPANDGDE